MQTIRIAQPTTELLASVKAACSAMGATVRLRKLSGSLQGRVRLVIVSGSKDQVRDGLVLSGALTSSGTPFASPASRFAWNGEREVNFFIPA